MFYFRNEIVDITQDIACCPHLRTGAKRTLIRTTSRPQHWYVAFGSDPVGLPCLPELLQVALRPVRPGDSLEVPNTRESCVVAQSCVAIKETNPPDLVIVTIRVCLKQFVKSVFAFALYHDI